MDEVIRFINYQLSGRDLVFDSSEAYTLNSDDDLLYVKEAKNDDIKSIKKTLLREGYANIDFTKPERVEYYRNVYKVINENIKDGND
ncbi:MAG: hypothetical protein ACTTJO_02000 [Metamycoplasmataceae bacterium]